MCFRARNKLEMRVIQILIYPNMVSLLSLNNYGLGRLRFHF
jgi:hypothetical protein